ncbi:MAG: hypothetical protein ACI9D0_001379, partial [Bacteroidia bacterium]
MAIVLVGGRKLGDDGVNDRVGGDAVAHGVEVQ